MEQDRQFEELWRDAPRAAKTFDPLQVASLPGAAQRYLRHALAPGAKLARAVRLRMHGTVRLGHEWLPFEAEQILRWDRGFIWHANVHKGRVPIVGSDRWLDGKGAMRWKLFGLLPVMSGGGPDVTRSAAGRLHLESMWLPAVLLDPEVRWVERDATHVEAVVAAHDEPSRLELAVELDGRLRSGCALRWGNPEGGDFHDVDCGGVVEAEGTFEGITVPTAIRSGWFFGSRRFERDGEFFRATIDDVTFK
jgi:hypothetical protein